MKPALANADLVRVILDRLEAAETRISTLNIRVVHLEGQQSIHRKLDRIITQGDTIMSNIDDTEAKVTALEAKIDEAIGTLRELKAIADGGGSAEERLAAINTRLGAAFDKLSAAETEVDPTPDA